MLDSQQIRTNDDAVEAMAATDIARAVGAACVCAGLRVLDQQRYAAVVQQGASDIPVIPFLLRAADVPLLPDLRVTVSSSTYGCAGPSLMRLFLSILVINVGKGWRDVGSRAGGEPQRVAGWASRSPHRHDAT
jgi:hypothetical protein